MKTNWPAFGFGCLLLATAAVRVQPASAQAAHESAVNSPSPTVSISSVDVVRIGQQTTVRISGTGDLRYQASRLDSPARLVLDFANTQLGVSRRSVSSEYSPVLGVRLGQPVPGQSRVVIDLAKTRFLQRPSRWFSTYNFIRDARSPDHTRCDPASDEASTEEIGGGYGSTDASSFMASLTGVDLGFASPADVPTAPAPQNPPATVAPATAGAPQRYTGDPISVNLKDVDLKDFFRLIHEISGLNVVLDPSVRGL